MAIPSRDQALSLLAPVNNHGDLAVKLSSLKQVTMVGNPQDVQSVVLDNNVILSGLNPGAFPVIELFWERMIEKDIRPGGFAEYMVKDIGMGMEVVEESEDERVAVLPGAALGTQMFSAMVANGDEKFGTQRLIFVIERINGNLWSFGIYFQTTCRGFTLFHWNRKVERWLEELWTWMVRFKDAVFSIALEGNNLLSVCLPSNFGCIVLLADPILDHKAGQEGASIEPENLAKLFSGVFEFMSQPFLILVHSRAKSPMPSILMIWIRLVGDPDILFQENLDPLVREKLLHALASVASQACLSACFALS
ncbi:hypothetical protein Pint_32865 [Pistacia integerrima]|uniref:Uncharacterized protein n=1 Tax=Pistacia integerrima TaxID=434235 RepID=A0ACC0X4X0_9ROSI|nr:hypothetical protein Pint_32865 [Pistacia integerrima]